MWSRTARLFLVGEKHGKNKVQFIREGHIRVRPNSRLVILGGCTLFANEPFTNQWCTRSIHLGNVSLFKTIELTKPPSEFSVLHNLALENPHNINSCLTTQQLGAYRTFPSIHGRVTSSVSQPYHRKYEPLHVVGDNRIASA